VSGYPRKPAQFVASVHGGGQKVRGPTNQPSARAYLLHSQPHLYVGMVPVSFHAGTGTWVVRGSPNHAVVKAGRPETFTFCA
jgi:hypothetical protein